MVIQGISSSVTDMGKLLKMSKRCFSWVFLIDGVQHTVEIMVSHLTRKKQVLHNGQVIHDATAHKDKTYLVSFQFMFQIEMNTCCITQKGENFHLKINNISFEDLCENQGVVPHIQYEQRENPFRATPNNQDQNTMYYQPEPEPQFQPQPTQTLGQKYQDDLGDLTALRGERTDKTVTVNQQSSDDDWYTRHQNRVSSHYQANYDYPQEQNQPSSGSTLAQKYQSQFGDLSALRGARSSNPSRAHVQEDLDYRRINPKVRGNYDYEQEQQKETEQKKGSLFKNWGGNKTKQSNNVSSKENLHYQEVASPQMNDTKEHNGKGSNPLSKIKNSVQGAFSKIHWSSH